MDAGRRTLAGFTVIELIAVLTIIGVLAAFAVPRMLNLSDGAHRAAVSGTAGAFTSAVRLANTVCLVRNWAGRDNLPGYGDGDVDFNTDCFPTDTTGNANAIGNNSPRCVRVWTGILAGAPTITTGAAGADYRARARSDVCTYLYLRGSATAREFTYNSLNGLVVQNNP